MTAIELRDVSRHFGGRPILRQVTLRVEQGTRLVLTGASGSGKSTLLRIVAGLDAPDAGTVLLMDRCVAHGGRNLVEPEERKIGMVFQDLALWPHMSVEAHLRFAIRYSGKGREGDTARMRAMLELVRLADHADAKPHALSGGQQQRLALARALIGEPRIVLMDEPLSGADDELKMHLQGEILRLHGLMGFTLIYVTHDREEAAAIGTRSVRLQSGTLVDA